MQDFFNLDPEMQDIEQFSADFLQVLKCPCAKNFSRPLVGYAKNDPTPSFVCKRDAVAQEFIQIKLFSGRFELQVSTFFGICKPGGQHLCEK